jgi:hypothetical protein
MITSKRRPASVGEILVEEFMAPLGLTQGAWICGKPPTHPKKQSASHVQSR